MAYTTSFELKDASGRYCVRLPAWLGSVAEVEVNGQLAGQMSVVPGKST